MSYKNLLYIDDINEKEDTLLDIIESCSIKPKFNSLSLNNVNKELSISEKKLKKSLENIQKNNNTNLNKELLPIQNIINEFIKKKNLILYGGTAINLYLSTKYKFYKKNDFPDFDIFSVSPIEDAKELANIIYTKTKNKYIYIKSAIHDNTYKIYYNFIPIVDISLIENKEYYNRLLELSNSKKNLAPIEYLKFSLHQELCKPISSSRRWEKVFLRLKIFDTEYLNFKKNGLIDKIKNIDKYLIINKNNEITDILNYILNLIKNNYPIIGSFAYKRFFRISKNKLIKNIYKKLKDKYFILNNESPQSFLSILNKDSFKTVQFFIKNIQKYIDKKKYKYSLYFDELVSYNINSNTTIKDKDTTKYCIKIIDQNNKIFNLLNIYSTNDICSSLYKINNYLIGSIDTIISNTYMDILKYPIPNYDKNYLLLSDILSYIVYDTKESNIYRDFNVECYGEEKTFEEIKKSNWGKKIKVYKYVVGVDKKNYNKYI